MQLNVVQEVSKHAITFNEYVKSKGGLLLSSYVKSSEKIKLQCAYQHTWMATPASVKSGHWCPVCAGKSSSAAKDKFLRIVQERGGMVLTNYTNNKTKVRVRCNNNHEWDVAPTDIIQGHWCAACAERCPKLAKEKLISTIEAKGGQLVGEYVSSNYKVTIRCAENHEWEANSLDVTSGGTWCPVCARNCTLASRQNFIEIVTERGGIVLGEYVNSKTHVRVKCNYGHEWETPPSSIKSGTWCPICARNSPIYAKETFLNIIANNKWTCLDDYVNDYTKLRMKCENGHIWETSPGNVKHGRLCIHCPRVESKGERAVSLILDEIGIKYTKQWIHPLLPCRKYDFYMNYNDINYIIEYDGRQHFENVDIFDNSMNLETRQEIDKIKTYVAYTTGYKIIRLDYTLNTDGLKLSIINALNTKIPIYVSNITKYSWLLGRPINLDLYNRELSR